MRPHGVGNRMGVHLVKSRVRLPAFAGLLVRAGAWMCLLLLVTSALALLAGRYIASTLADHRALVEGLLRDHGFNYVRIGGISGHFKGLQPGLRVQQLRFDFDGQPALTVDELVVRLDSLNTLFHLSPVISELRLSGLRFVLDRVNGRTAVRGMPAADGYPELDYLLDSLPHVDVLMLDKVDIAIYNEGVPLRLTSVENRPWLIVEDSGSGDEKVVSLSALLTRESANGEARASELQLSGSYVGDFRQEGFKAEAFLEAPRVHLEDIFRLAGEQARLTRADMKGRLWVSLQPGDLDITGLVELGDVRLDLGQGEADFLSGASATARFRGTSMTRGSLVIPALTLRRDQTRMDLTGVRLAVTDEAGDINWAGALREIDLTRVMAMASEMAAAGVIGEPLGTALTSVNPRGRLVDLGLASSFRGEGIRMVGRLERGSIEPYLGAPAISNLNGLLSIGPARGYMDIVNDDFVIFFENLFDEAWSFTAARGRLGYETEPDRVVVRSGLLEVDDGELKAFGKVTLGLSREVQARTAGVAIGVRNANLADVNNFMPKTVNRRLRDWLENAMRQGRVRETGFVFHGALARQVPKVWKTHSVYCKFEDAVLDYHADWPALEEFEGTVHAASHEVTIRGATGRIFGAALTDIDMTIPLPLGGADRVLIEGAAKGGVADALRILDETPLAEKTDNISADWSGEGEMLARLSLDVPIGPRTGQEVGTQVSASFSDATLHMRDLDLKAVGLEGTGAYATGEGLSSTGFTGRMFGRDISGRIESELMAKGGETRLLVLGTIDLADLYAWSGQRLLTRAEGVARYAARVHLPFGGAPGRPYVEAGSDLLGVTMNLPPPLAKSDAKSVRDLIYRQTFLEEGYLADLSVESSIKLSLKVEDGVAIGGGIHFGEDPFGAVTYDAIRVSGGIPHLDYGVWKNTVDEVFASSGASLEKEIERHFHSAHLRIDRLTLFGMELDDTLALVTRQADRWRLDIDNEMLGGVVEVPDEDTSPARIHLGHLHLVSAEGQGEDPLGEMDPLGLDDVDFAIRRLTVDGDDYGAWSFKFRTGEGRALFTDLKADIRGLLVQSGSQVSWQLVDGEHHSRFTGDIRIPDLGDSLTRFGIASSIEGESFKLDADLTWPGSPAMIDIARLRGVINLHEGKGKFVQADAGGALKLLGIFDFAQLARRFRFDFSDVISEGYEFDGISGTTALDAGLIDVTQPLVILSPSGKFKLWGSLDLNTRELDNEMIVTLPFGKTLPWYAAYSAIATGPLAGAGVIIAQKVFEDQIDTMSSAKYRISGTIEEPVIELVSIFDDSVGQGTGKEAAEEEETKGPRDLPATGGEDVNSAVESLPGSVAAQQP